jgi:ribonuclease R
MAQVALRERLDAHRVVEDFMIAANVAAAKALESKAAPVVYRIHEPPNREKLIALKDYLATFERKLALGQVITPALFNRMLKSIEDDVEKALIMAVLRSQTQAYYGPRNAGTSACRWAAMRISPRRSAAIRTCWSIARWSMRSIWNSRRPVAICPRFRAAWPRPSDLARICDAISTAERRAMEAERETIDRYVAAWLSTRVGDVFDCRITGVSALACSPRSSGWAAMGWCRSVLGDERFHHDERRRCCAANRPARPLPSAIVCGCVWPRPMPDRRVKVRTRRRDGRIEKRGAPPDKAGMKRRGSHLVGKRGRPANIRHQGKSGD